MKTTICYYTGSGNSLWVARTLTAELGDAEMISIADWERVKAIDSEGIGFVFPVHIWGIPGPVIKFVNELLLPRPEYIFAVAVNAGQVANTLVQLGALLKERNLLLSSGFEINLPSNYAPWGGPGPKEKQAVKFNLARNKISRIAASVRAKETMPVEKGPLWARLLFTPIYKMTFNRIPTMDRQFWVDEKCNHCAICSRVCPSENITMEEGKPVWNHRCEQCFACLQWCPQEAIQYGKKTPKYERYHHPDVHVTEVIKQRPSKE